MNEIEYDGQVFTVLFPDLFRPLTPAELDGLRSSIRKNGVKVPVFVDDEDGVIDGANRLRLAAEAGIPLKDVHRTVIRGMSLDAKRQLAESLNADRRQLTPEEQQRRRQERIHRVAEKRAEGKSTRQIAEEEGVSQPQVIHDLQTAPDKGLSGARPDRITGRDGKQYPINGAKKSKKTAESVAVDQQIRGLRVEEGLTGPEIADRLGMDYEAVRSRMKRMIETDEAQTGMESPLRELPKAEQEGPSPVPTDAAERKRAKTLGLAYEAINCLSRIAKNDPSRDEAFRIVKHWLRRNQ